MKFPKLLVTNFGNRNFMPMGRVSMHSKCLDFFFQVLGGWWGEFFSFFLCSHQVPNVFPKSVLCLQNSAPALAYVKNGDTVLKREISCSQWEGSACTHEQFNFFFVGWGRGTGTFCFFPWFSKCSHHVPIKFSNCSQMHSPLCSQ